MADVNITGKGTFAGNNYTVPAGQNSVSFHSAEACTVCFTNSATFNTSSLGLPKGGSPTSLNIASRVATNYTIDDSGSDCSGSLKADTSYTIDMSSSTGGTEYHHQKH